MARPYRLRSRRNLAISVLRRFSRQKTYSFKLFLGVREGRLKSDTMAVEARVDDKAKCQACGVKNQVMKRCTRCKAVFYCSRECQVKHWQTHKFLCGPNPQETIQDHQDDCSTVRATPAPRRAPPRHRPPPARRPPAARPPSAAR